MTTQEVAEKLVNYCREGKNFDAKEHLYADSIISIEPVGTPHNEITKGIDAVMAKGQQFFSTVEEMHSVIISDPLVIDDFFICKMQMDITFKEQGRMQMEELAIYAVKDGKIISEEFFFNTSHEKVDVTLTENIAQQLIGLCKENKHFEAIDSLYASDVVCLEPPGATIEEIQGIDTVKLKSKKFHDNILELHSYEVSQPLVADQYFACIMKTDATLKKHGRMVLNEICVYKVEGGKITQEEFFFTPNKVHELETA